MSIILSLVLIGFFLIVLEILVVPGTTVVGVAGFVCVVIGVFYAFYYEGAMVGGVSFGGSLLVAYLLYRLLAKSPIAKKMQLEKSVDEKIDLVQDKVKVGEEGVSISRLSPVGKGRFSNGLFEVTTYGSFIAENTPIKVEKIVKNKIFVNEINN